MFSVRTPDLYPNTNIIRTLNIYSKSWGPPIRTENTHIGALSSLSELPTGVLIGADEVFCRQVPELLGARALVLQWLREVHRACGGKTLSA